MNRLTTGNPIATDWEVEEKLFMIDIVFSGGMQMGNQGIPSHWYQQTFNTCL